MSKLQELKRSGKGIEEIYKYTNDIIFEEEDEEEEHQALSEEDYGRSSADAKSGDYGSFSQRSKSVNHALRPS